MATINVARSAPELERLRITLRAQIAHRRDLAERGEDMLRLIDMPTGESEEPLPRAP
jgi:hypothetical protein